MDDVGGDVLFIGLLLAIIIVVAALVVVLVFLGYNAELATLCIENGKQWVEDACIATR